MFKNRKATALALAVGFALVFMAGYQVGKLRETDLGAARAPEEAPLADRAVRPVRQPSPREGFRSSGDSSPSEGADLSESKVAPELVAERLANKMGDILREADRVERDQQFIDFILGLDGDGLASLADDIRDAESESPLEAEKFVWHRTLVLDAWMKVAPDAALAWADGRERNRMLENWGEVSPQQALAWIKTQPTEKTINGDSWGGDMLNIIEGLVKIDPAEAMSYAVEMNPGWARGSAIEEVMETVTKTDPETAKAMVSSIRSPEVRAEASGILAGQLATADLEQAKAWVYSLGGDARAEADVELAQTISFRDDDGARAWVEQIEDAGTRAEAVGAVIQSVARADPYTTAEWLTQFPMTTEYDEARRKFALAITSVDPDAAREWASSIVDARSRSYWSEIVDGDIAENR